MSFTAYELLVLLKKQTNLSRDDIHDNGGPHPRVQQRILNENALYKIKNETALVTILIAQGVLPWDRSWQFPLARLRELQDRDDLAGIERQLGALYTLAEAVIESGPELVERQFYVGALYFAGLYLMPFVKPKNGAYVRDRVVAANKACKWLERLAVELKADTTPAADMLRWKTAANIVVVQWNMRKDEERNSEEMKAIIAKSGYIDWALRQSELFPKLDTPAFNALAIASRFHWRHLYPQLHEALSRANPAFASHNEYNSDFDDFRTWLAAQRSTNIQISARKEQNMKRSRRISGGVIAILVVAACALGIALVASVEPSLAQLADLRPHQIAADLRPHIAFV